MGETVETCAGDKPAETMPEPRPDLKAEARSRDAAEADKLAADLEAAVAAGADLLAAHPAAGGEAAQSLHLDRLGIDRAAQHRASALVLANALMLHELLAHHADGLRPRMRGEGKSATRDQWRRLPALEAAAGTLEKLPDSVAADVLDAVQPAAKRLAKCALSAQADLSGRVLHKLLIGGKHLSPNYTTLPAATLLAQLAFDEVECEWGRVDEVRKLKVGDPACGTGALLAAAAEAIVRRHAQAAHRPDPTLNRLLVEDVLWGRDAAPAAVQVAISTLCMRSPQSAIRGSNLRVMPLAPPMEGARAPRLGSLDLLRSARAGPSVHSESIPFQDIDDGLDDTMRASGKLDVAMLNPPFFKASGNILTVDGRRTWKPFFGLMVNPDDSAAMRRELRRRLDGGPAKMRAGGSAFALLADELLKDGGALAAILPLSALTGSDWSGMRQLWGERCELLWAIVSHDQRSRAKTRHAPGRRHVSFSESSRNAEAMIVARKRRPQTGHRLNVVNLAHNPDTVADAQLLAQALADIRAGKGIPNMDDAAEEGAGEIHANGRFWGTVATAPADGPNWDSHLGAACAFAHLDLVRTGVRIAKSGETPVGGAPCCRLDKVAETGPWHMQVKGSRGPCEITEGAGTGKPALWRHRADAVKTLAAAPNARLNAKPGRGGQMNDLWRKAGRLHIALELGLAPQRAAAVMTDEVCLGLSSWSTLRLRRRRCGAEEALALWLNGTLGVLVRICYSNRPYLGRSRLPIRGVQSLPVLDVRKLDAGRLREAGAEFRSVANKPLLGFADMSKDETRDRVDAVVAEVLLGWDSKGHDWTKGIRAALAQQPMVQSRC